MKTFRLKYQLLDVIIVDMKDIRLKSSLKKIGTSVIIENFFNAVSYFISVQNY